MVPETRQCAPETPVEDFYFQWDLLTSGDCGLSDGVLYRSDGTAIWQANVPSSSGGGDVWLATFTFFDNHGVQLWQFVQIDSRQMDAHWVYSWFSDNQLFFPAYLYPYITGASLRYHC
jgi:hypothetical protein